MNLLRVFLIRLLIDLPQQAVKNCLNRPALLRIIVVDSNVCLHSTRACSGTIM